MQVEMDFGWLLERFLVDFGAKLEAKLGQVGTKIPKKRVPRRCLKMYCKKVMQVYAVDAGMRGGAPYNQSIPQPSGTSTIHH